MISRYGNSNPKMGCFAEKMSSHLCLRKMDKTNINYRIPLNVLRNAVRRIDGIACKPKAFTMVRRKKQKRIDAHECSLIKNLRVPSILVKDKTRTGEGLRIITIRWISFRPKQDEASYSRASTACEVPS